MNQEEADKLNEEQEIKSGQALAFPIDTGYSYHKGMSKREYMATQLMSSFIPACGPKIAANRAVEAADYLLIELNKNSK